MLDEFQSILRCARVSSAIKTVLRQHVVELAGKASVRTKQQNLKYSQKSGYIFVNAETFIFEL